MDKAQTIQYAIDTLGEKVPLEWTDKQGRHISILQTGVGRLFAGDILKPVDNSPVWFKVMVDGRFLNGDGWYGFVNPPMAIVVPDGTYSDVVYPGGEIITQPNTIIKQDMLAAFFEYIEQAVS